MSKNERLDDVVERLLADRRFLRRFRRNPGRALSGFGLSAREAEAVKSGNAEELVALGLDPRFVWPTVAPARVGQAWLARSGKRLAPLAFAVAAAALAPGAAQAARNVPGRRRAALRLAEVAARHRTGMRRASLRAGQRRAAPALRNTGRNATRAGISGAVRNVISPGGPGGEN